MFIATLSTGKTIVEGRDVAHFDACPSGITSLQLTMPYLIHKRVGTRTIQRNAVISLGRYDQYYVAKQAIANVMTVNQTIGHITTGGQGTITHEVLAGIDLKRNEVVYLTLNLTTGDVTVDKFDYDWWLQHYRINPTSLKNGARKPVFSLPSEK